MSNVISIVDFFAGPGGLGEGFTKFTDGIKGCPYRIALSVEKDSYAHATLRLRSFLRRFPDADIPASYYDFVMGRSDAPFDLLSKAEWQAAQEEVIHATLGDPASDELVASRLERLRLKGKPWVLIGGPPCQAYSLVGRSRNAGNEDYRPEADERHFLYRHYLRVLDELQPPVFVMENVKGILSSKISGKEIFSQILKDLSRPARAFRGAYARGVRYRIRAVQSGVVFNSGDDPMDLDWHDYVVRAESMGIPQSRHRVILIGVREDLDPALEVNAPTRPSINLVDIIGGFPKIRSGLSKEDDYLSWSAEVISSAKKTKKWLSAIFKEASGDQLEFMENPKLPLKRSAQGLPNDTRLRKTCPAMGSWYEDRALEQTLNHEARSHMSSDIGRYFFCAAWAKVKGKSPGVGDFPEELAPKHTSWGTGAFNDRFRVQLPNGAASTVTSHIAKDGHYFIHYDPMQCRSLTVREAARIQTFPDNYFFVGNRTQQYTQVGNAVPPLVALDIANLVHEIMSRS